MGQLKTNLKTTDKFTIGLVELLFKLMPTCYIEGFAELQNKSNKLSWPKNPHSIYTCDSFEYDELFKLWSAEKVLNGTNFIIGQHGNNAGSNKFISPTIDEEVSDRFITWGWDKKNEKYKKGFIFKNLNISLNKNSKKLLLILTHRPLRISSWDEAYFHHLYKEKNL